MKTKIYSDIYSDYGENNSILFKKLVSFCTLIIIACADFAKCTLRGYCAPVATSFILFFFLSKNPSKTLILN